MLSSNSSVLALDVGGRRVGVAVANVVARLARPVTALENDETFITELEKQINEHDVALLVVGLPRGLDGQHTEQTAVVEIFVETLKEHIELPIYWQDEAVTSVKAEAELDQRRGTYGKGDIDALAATYILEDFLHDHPQNLPGNFPRMQA
jgi:putative Holliday junction resolvase